MDKSKWQESVMALHLGNVIILKADKSENERYVMELTNNSGKTLYRQVFDAENLDDAKNIGIDGLVKYAETRRENVRWVNIHIMLTQYKYEWKDTYE